MSVKTRQINKQKMNQRFSQHYKILILGEGEVGKTCILTRYSDDTFIETHLMTIGIDFRTKDLIKNNQTIRLQIWDTAGQDRYKTVTRQFYKGAQGIIVVYDITKEQTFLNVKNWIEQIDQNAKPNVKKIIVGNKCDLDSKRKVTYEQGQSLANEYNIEFMEVSAFKTININECFDNLVNQLLKVSEQNNITKGELINLNQNRDNQIAEKEGCCGKKSKKKSKSIQ